MESDKHYRDVPVQHELTFAGVPARVLLELDLGRNGATTLVPVGDLVQVNEYGRYTTLSVIQGTMLRRVEQAIDRVQELGLD